jgi:hypothetical protein
VEPEPLRRLGIDAAPVTCCAWCVGRMTVPAAAEDCSVSYTGNRLNPIIVPR